MEGGELLSSHTRLTPRYYRKSFEIAKSRLS